MTEAKIHPPSSSRIAEARAAGFAPRPLLVGLSAALFALASWLHFFGRSLAQAFVRLLEVPLDAFAHDESAKALSLVAPLIADVLGQSALSALAVAASVVLGSLLAQGVRLSLARASTRRFTAPKLSLEASLLAIVGLLALTSFALFDALWLEPEGLLGFAVRWLDQLALLFSALAIIDAAFARAQFFRALFLTRRELREEQREAFGAPELRAARASARRQLSSEQP
jgi:type III secretory pathway component EscU